MNNDRIKEYIESRATDLLQRDGSGKGYICPICGSGSGKNGTGITSKDGGKHFTCWTGCFSNSDIIDIVGLQYGLTDYRSKLEKTAELLGVSLDEDSTRTQIDREPEEDYTDFFLQAEKKIGQTDYHRGLSPETLSRFHIGYVENWRHPKAVNAPFSPRLIIPTGKGSYLARDTRSGLTDEQKKYSKQKVGTVQIFNREALKNKEKPVFVVEGEIDALSIIEVGGEAVALGSVSNRELFIRELEKNRPEKPLLLALDNDERGQDANNKLSERLKGIGVTFYPVDVAKPYKDANEALMNDRESFTAAVIQAEDSERARLLQDSVRNDLLNFLDNIAHSKDTSYYPTGFHELDRLLDGGLYSGLYILGAISSLGKTTFCLQVADQVAKKGHDVLVFSLEMERKELIAKSLSRYTYLLNREKGGDSRDSKTTRGILTGSFYDGYRDSEIDLISDAIVQYSDDCGDNLYIIEGIGDIGTAQIRKRVEQHISITGNRPVVLIDYLQILAPEDTHSTDKQNTDKAVLDLKKMSRDFHIPVIGISSFNRENYTSPVNLSSFKESGAIEYSSDVLIGLQYEGMDYQEGESDKARTQRIYELRKDMEKKAKEGKPQPIQVKILKNRNGLRGDVLLSMIPKFNLYEDRDKEDEPIVAWESLK